MSGDERRPVGFQKGQNPRAVLRGQHRERGPKRYHYTIYDVLRQLGWAKRRLYKVLEARKLEIGNFDHVILLCVEVLSGRPAPPPLPAPRPRPSVKRGPRVKRQRFDDDAVLPDSLLPVSDEVGLESELEEEGWDDDGEEDVGLE